MGQMLKFIFQKEVQRIFSHFTSLFDIRIAFFSAIGEEINVGQDRPICNYCSSLRENLGLREICLDLDRRKRLAAAKARSMVVYQCHGGMTEAITPVFLEEELTGYVMIGQFRSEAGHIKPKWIAQWKEKYGTDELTKSYEQTPVYSPKYIQEILGLFALLVDYIISQHMIRLGERNPIGMLLNYLHEHVEENMTMQQAARLTCMSQSSLAHQFKEQTGVSFKKYQINLKLEKARAYLSGRPDMSIREVAGRLGYEDPLYFSRLFSRHCGQSPRSVKKTNKRSSES